jgi:N6-adenosine-specific RNA methylase IME4
MEIAAAQIRFRAERRLGELILAQKETVGLAKGGQPYQADATRSEAEQVEPPVPTLEQAGIDRKLSSRAQRMAAIEPDKFEALLARHREEVEAGNTKVSVDLMRTSAEADGREHRRNLQQALSDETAALPTGRRFPVVYADPPWRRKQGVTSRSYENHYPTMSWDDICALPVKDLLLPDAWLFLWVPRAHMFALHPVDMEFADDAGCVITRKVLLPLAWAVARAWGCDGYSTAWVWTKTDEEHPDDQGGGVIAYDQDEILLLFKRGRGLPKPDTKEKFGSNHRERSKPLGHSRKPDFYRQMIATMCGGLPVLELFARVDADNPLPPQWQGWGNQASAERSSVTMASGATSSSSPSPAQDAIVGVRATIIITDDVEETEPPPADQTNTNTDAPGCTASPAGGAATTPAASPDLFADDGLDIPAFLRRVEGVQPSYSGRIVGTGGEYAIDDRGALIAKDFLSPGEAKSLEEFEALPLLGDTELAGASADRTPPEPAGDEPDEFTILRTFANFAMPDRIAICRPRAADYIARGLVFAHGGLDDWGLTATGWDRLDALKRERAGLKPKVLTAPAVADLSDDEQDMREVLSCIAGANRCMLSVTARTEYERDLIGLGYLAVTDDKGGLAVTDAGRAWLAETEAACAPQLTEPSPPSPVQLTIFGAGT